MENDNKDEIKELVELGNELKDTYLLALGMIQSFSKQTNLDVVQDYFNQHGDEIKNPAMILGALLSHTRFIMDLVAPEYNLDGEGFASYYAYHFYANILPDIEYVFNDMDDESYERLKNIIESVKDKDKNNE